MPIARIVRFRANHKGDESLLLISSGDKADAEVGGIR